MRKIAVLRKLSRVSAAMLGIHVALLAVYFSAGMVMGMMAPQWFKLAGKTLFTSGIATLAIFCLSTQLDRSVGKKGCN